MPRIYPSRANPYYIISPPYERVSAGIKALHLLCHHLNLSGHSAYIFMTNREHVAKDDQLTQPDFLTPLLTRRIAQDHFQSGRTPIVIYPEIISGNPLNADCVVRYVLNFPGLLGGDKTFSQSDICFSYSNTLAKSIGHPENILFIPTSDTNIFYPPSSATERSGSCFYAGKYQEVHRGKLFPITQNSIEITRNPELHTPQIIAELFRRSEVFYTYENTALATEATLCGCPAVFLPNPYLEQIISLEELGQEGYAWGAEPAEIERAKESVPKAIENYNRSVKNFNENLAKFIQKTQNAATHKNYSTSHYERLISLLFRDARLIGNSNINYEGDYAAKLKKLPLWVERLIGEVLCSVGLTNDGELLWNDANARYFKKKTEDQEYAPILKKLPWSIEKKIGNLLLKFGLEKDGLFLITRAQSRAPKSKKD